MFDFKETLEDNKSRSEDRDDFLKKKKYHLYEQFPITGDASRKKFTRLQKGKQSVIFLDACPLSGENPLAIAATTELLQKNDIAVPAILEADLDLGFFIIEDLGEKHLKHYLEVHDKEEVLYRDAVHILQKIQNIPVAEKIAYQDTQYHVKEYSLNKLISEARIFTQWHFPKIMGRPIPSVAYDEFDSILRGLLTPIVEKNSVYTLLDYHADNIMIAENDKKISLNLIDFQDMHIGHPAYDMVSMLQDVRRTVSKNTQEKLLAEYTKDYSDEEKESFKRAYLILGAQRLIKILGIFARLWVRDQKDQYISYVPYCWQLLEDNLSYPELYPLKEWFHHWVPSMMRKSSYLTGA